VAGVSPPVGQVFQPTDLKTFRFHKS